MNEQSRIAPQKPNRRLPRAGFSGGRGFQRHLLSRNSVRTELRDGEVRRLLICGSLGVVTEESMVWTDERQDIWLLTGREDKGSGESQKTGSGSGMDGN